MRGFAQTRGLEVWAVAQVQQDSERARRLAADLGGRALDWPAATDPARQEERLRELYARTAIAVSDRLHVLIAAFTEGAVPFASLTVESDKIDRHFRAIGISGVATVATHPTREIVDRALHTRHSGATKNCSHACAQRGANSPASVVTSSPCSHAAAPAADPPRPRADRHPLGPSSITSVAPGRSRAE